jgi:3'-5' exoribonuclease
VLAGLGSPAFPAIIRGSLFAEKTQHVASKPESQSMPRVYVRDLRDGDNVNEIYLLADRQLRANRNANLYFLATLRDRSGMISGLMWNVTEDSVKEVSAGDFVRVKGKVQQYQGNLQLILTSVQSVPDSACDPADFQVQPQAAAGRYLLRLRELLESIRHPDLAALAYAFLGNAAFVNGLCGAPAGVKAHHAYVGGLIEHVVSMCELADRVAPLYPALDRELLLLGVLLHDIGKIRELAWDPALVYTDEGQLLGHIHLGNEILSELVRTAEQQLGHPLEAEKLLRLRHMIISHHGTREFGSPALPMTPEALALHYIDALDAKMHEFVRSIQDDVNTDSAWTPFSPRMDRRLFKGQIRRD